MAKQKSHIKYEGTLGEVRHFKIKGLSDHFAGLKGGPTKDQILKDKAFKRTRENMSEFGGSATAAKSLRVGMASLVKTMGDPQLSGRLTKVFRRINKEANGKRGERPILLTANKELLQGFEFDKNLALASVLTAVHTLTPNADRNETTLDVPGFNPDDYISSPAGATHFRLINAIVAVSDWQYDTNTSKYEPKEATQNGMSDVAYSNYLSVDTPIGAVTSVIASLPGAPVLSADVALVNSVGIEFYQLVDGTYYLFASGNAMNVERLF